VAIGVAVIAALVLRQERADAARVSPLRELGARLRAARHRAEAARAQRQAAAGPARAHLVRRARAAFVDAPVAVVVEPIAALRAHAGRLAGVDRVARAGVAPRARLARVGE